MPDFSRTRDEVAQAFTQSLYQVTKTRRGFKVEYTKPRDAFGDPDRRYRRDPKEIAGIIVKLNRNQPVASVSAYHGYVSASSNPFIRFLLPSYTEYAPFSLVKAISAVARDNPEALPEMLKVTTEVLERNGWQLRMKWTKKAIIFAMVMVFAVTISFIAGVFIFILLQL